MSAPGREEASIYRLRERFRAFLLEKQVRGVTAVEIGLRGGEDIFVVVLDPSHRAGTIPDFFDGIAVELKSPSSAPR
jgi:hypothetical protein